MVLRFVDGATGVVYERSFSTSAERIYGSVPLKEPQDTIEILLGLMSKAFDLHDYPIGIKNMSVVIPDEQYRYFGYCNTEFKYWQFFTWCAQKMDAFLMTDEGKTYQRL